MLIDKAIRLFHKRTSRLRTLFCWALLIMPSLSQATSLEVFYSDPLMSHVSLSPDGKYLAGLRNHEGQSTLMTFNLDTKEIQYHMKSDNIARKFNWLRWAENNQHLLLSIRFTSKEAGTIFDETRLLSIDIKNGSKVVNLFTPDAEAMKKYPGWISQFQDNIVCQTPKDPDFIWVAVDREYPNSKGVYRVNVKNGRMLRVLRSRSHSVAWILDRNCEPRISQHYDDDTRAVHSRVVDTKSKAWRNIWSYTHNEEPAITPLGFGKNPDEVYLIANHNGFNAVFKADLSTPDVTRELIYADENADVSGRLIYSERLKDVVGIYLSGATDKPIYWNEEFKALQGGIDKAMPDSRNILVALSHDERRYLLYSQGKKNPGLILYGNRDAKTLEMVSSAYPDITEAMLPNKSWIEYKARDGLTIDAIVTQPINAGKSPLPTIVFPHGGPMASDDDEFDMFATYFSNKGYLVIQPNFRGSTGRGFDYMQHAIGGFGLAMQDDLEDGLNHLVKQGLADPKRVCIVGASYGGYAALMGATKTPDLFRCAVSFAGLFDMQLMHKRARVFANKNAIRDQLGNDKAQLQAASPINGADKIKIPVLLIHGAKDTVVHVEQSRDMAKTLKKHKKNYEYLELENATHNLDNLNDRKLIFEAIDKFLDKHLPI